MATTRVWSTVGMLGLMASAAVAQGRLLGAVRDSAGAAIAGAEVSVENTRRRTTTARNGSFLLEGVPAGTAVVLIRRLGYGPYRETLRVYDGDNRVGDIVLRPIDTELDTVAIREQYVLRERPLLREFEENRRLGLGQFVTRADLARLQGGFLVPVFANMRGMIIVRSDKGMKTWIANRGVRSRSRTELEDFLKGSFTEKGLPFIETISPPGADTTYCFPQVYLDHSRISTDRMAPNIARYNPDQLEAIEVYMGAADTPPRYISGVSSCGVIVLHTRVPDLYSRRRVAARESDEPTRSPGFASVSLSMARSGADCPSCGTGVARDAILGVTLKDRWVVGGRYASWTSTEGGPQSIGLRHAVLEWYPRPEPGRVKWFVNGGLGVTSVSLRTTTRDVFDHTDSLRARNVPSFGFGTGVDIAIYRRLVLTPFIGHTRTLASNSENTFCSLYLAADGSEFRGCLEEPVRPRVFNLTQFGTRIGWR